ncbi:MAG: SIMPL domain-containing protein [Candidatus Nomurabacteria bacterium]|nr:SIMPL domain-containing protein [Candidatus Nomurabacteria bacterium]
METLWTNKKFIKVSVIFVVLLCIFTFMGICKENHNSFKDINNQNTIVFNGHGEVKAVPDIANVYFTIHKEAKTVKEAQAGVASIEKASLDFLKTKNILDKDIKTTNSSFNPKYENQALVPCTQFGCPPSNNVIVGYESSENITVKVRNTDDAGAIMQGLGTLGVEQLSGPDFAIDDTDALQIQAREKAILDAKTKAALLAKDLGIRLGKITSFSEGTNYPVPMMYAKADMAVAGVSSAPAIIPKGENTITSDVTITYEIR